MEISSSPILGTFFLLGGAVILEEINNRSRIVKKKKKEEKNCNCANYKQRLWRIELIWIILERMRQCAGEF